MWTRVRSPTDNNEDDGKGVSWSSQAAEKTNPSSETISVLTMLGHAPPKKTNNRAKLKSPRATRRRNRAEEERRRDVNLLARIAPRAFAALPQTCLIRALNVPYA